MQERIEPRDRSEEVVNRTRPLSIQIHDSCCAGKLLAAILVCHPGIMLRLARADVETAVRGAAARKVRSPPSLRAHD